MSQTKKGLIKGIKGIEVIPYVNTAGVLSLDAAKKFYIKNVKTAQYKKDVQAGANAQQTGSGIVLVNFRDADQLLGYNVDFADSKVELETAYKLLGGKVRRIAPGDAASAIDGWNGPSDLSTVPFVQLNIWSINIESDNNAQGYLVRTLFYCRCNSPEESQITEKDFVQLDWTAYASKNPLYVDEATTPDEMPGPAFLHFESVLPAGLQ